MEDYRDSNDSLFASNENEIALPSEALNEDDTGLPAGIEDVATIISKDTVEQVIIPDAPGEEFDRSNYLIDLSRLKSWSYMQRQSLKSLISKNGDTSIYLLSGAVDKPVLLGKGKREILDFILPGIKQGVFDNQIRIYKDFDDESEKKEIDNLDVTDFKLDL